MTSSYEYVQKMLEKGIYAVPCNHTKPIRPLIDKYEHWRRQWPGDQEYLAIWARHQNAGILMFCQGVEVVDLDVKNQTFEQDIIADFERELEALSPGLLSTLFCEVSPSGGRHYIFRVESSSVSFTAARRPGEVGEPHKAYTLCDYLADQKMCRVAPSPGYVPLHGDLLNLPVLTDEQRRLVISAALSLNTYYDTQAYAAASGVVNGERPGDIFNRTVTVDEMVNLAQSVGWRVLRQRGNYIDFNRPGAKNKQGVDATLNVVGRWWYPWSSSDNFGHTKAYDFFGMYAHMKFGGNFIEATKSLSAMGYGRPVAERRSDPVTASPLAHINELHQVDSPAENGWATVLPNHRWDFEKKVMAAPVVWLKHPTGERYVAVASMGNIIAFIGVAKSFKSQVAHSLVSAAISGRHPVGWRVEMPFERPNVVLIDTEQSNADWDKSCRRIHWMGDRNTPSPIFSSYELKEFNAQERRNIINHLVESDPMLGMLVIDGGLDLIGDYNDIKESAEVIQWLLAIKAKGILVVLVLHCGETNPKKPIGHFGSYIARKAESVFSMVIANPKEDDIKYRRVTVTNALSRNEPARRFTVQSHWKMIYPFESGVPDYYYKYTGEEEKQPDDISDPMIDLAPEPVKPPTFRREEPSDSEWRDTVNDPLQDGLTRFEAAGFEIDPASIARSVLGEPDNDDEIFDQWLGEIGAKE